jgi:ABC-type branched-subunit amino acid transport system substrate-binding protein
LKNGFILMAVSVLLVLSLAVGGCSMSSSGPKILKIGGVLAQNWLLGQDGHKTFDLEAERMASKGGLEIGGQKYFVQFIIDDTRMDYTIAKAMGEKEILQDGVKFILSDPYAMPLFRLCEDNKVAGVVSTYDFGIFDPQWNWMVNCGGGSATFPSFIIYLGEKFPGKTFTCVLPDRPDGRLAGKVTEHMAKVGGLKPLDFVYYPMGLKDYSDIGKKIKDLNPDILDVYGGGPPLDAACAKAAYAAGWRGQLVGHSTAPAAAMLGIAGPEAVEGMIGLGWPMEFDPCTTPEATQFKAAWVAKYGKWTSPEPAETVTWYNLRDAMVQTGSVDPAVIIKKMKGGMTFSSPLGDGQRIPRLDFGNSTTVDLVLGSIPVKQIKGGKISQIDTISLKDQVKRATLAFGAPW